MIPRASWHCCGVAFSTAALSCSTIKWSKMQKCFALCTQQPERCPAPSRKGLYQHSPSAQLQCEHNLKQSSRNRAGKLAALWRSRSSALLLKLAIHFALFDALCTFTSTGLGMEQGYLTGPSPGCHRTLTRMLRSWDCPKAGAQRSGVLPSLVGAQTPTPVD